jgi:hypothetical protein
MIRKKPALDPGRRLGSGSPTDHAAGYIRESRTCDDALAASSWECRPVWKN